MVTIRVSTKYKARKYWGFVDVAHPLWEADYLPCMCTRRVQISRQATP